MAKNKTLTADEVIEATTKLELEDQLSVYFQLKTIIDEKQKYIADQLDKIKDTQAKMNGGK